MTALTRTLAHRVLFLVFLFVLGAVPLAHAVDDRIPDNVVAQETETCMKQAPKEPAWFGSVYCPCVMKETQKSVTYSDYQAVNKEFLSPEPGPRPAFERNKNAMEAIAKACLVLVEKRSLEETKMGAAPLSDPR